MSLVKATTIRAAALMVVALLLVAGCGGGDDSSDTATTSTGIAEAGSNGGAGGKQGEGGNGKSSGEGANGKQGSTVPQPEGEREPGITPKQREKATTASVTLESPAFKSGAALSTTYTCDGKNTSPPLKWTGLPSEAAELVLMVMNLRPVNESLFFDWAVAGLDPSLSSIEEGKLPPGAVEGENSFGESGYGLCPPEAGKPENYIFILYALPETLDPEPGFDPKELREEALAQHGNAGILAATYKSP